MKLLFFSLTQHNILRASQVALVVKNSLVDAGDVRDASPSLAQEDPLEEGMVVHSRVLAWRIPWTQEPSGLQYIGSQKVKHN